MIQIVGLIVAVYAEVRLFQAMFLCQVEGVRAVMVTLSSIVGMVAVGGLTVMLLLSGVDASALE